MIEHIGLFRKDGIAKDTHCGSTCLHQGDKSGGLSVYILNG